MPVRIVTIQPRSRAGAIALAAGVVVVGGVLVVLGTALLLALAATTVVVGAGALAWRRLKGGAPRREEPPAFTRAGLDPRLEVRADEGEGARASGRVLPPEPDE